MLAPVLAYAEAACEATNQYLTRLTDDELDRQVSFFGREGSVADVLARFVAHMPVMQERSRRSRVCKGCRAYPSETSGWQLDDVDLGEHLARCRKQRLMVTIAPVG